MQDNTPKTETPSTTKRDKGEANEVKWQAAGECGNL